MACFKKKKPTLQVREETKPDTGPEIKKGKVIELTSNNIQVYLRKLDVALVLFHLPQETGSSAWTMRHFTKAATVTQRANHAFAVIDCEKYGALCINEGALSMPTFKMYSKGKDVGFQPETRSHLYGDMKSWVENFNLDSCPA